MYKQVVDKVEEKNLKFQISLFTKGSLIPKNDQNAINLTNEVLPVFKILISRISRNQQNIKQSYSKLLF